MTFIAEAVLFLHEQPSIFSGVLCGVKQGQSLPALQEVITDPGNRWVQVVFEEGQWWIHYWDGRPMGRIEG